MDRNAIVLAALREPQNAVKRRLTEEIRAAMPGKTPFEVSISSDTLAKFCNDGHCNLTLVENFNFDAALYTWNAKISQWRANSWWLVKHEDVEFEFVSVRINREQHETQFSLIVCDAANQIERFLIAFEEFENDLSHSVLVYDQGCFEHDEELFSDIKVATSDNLVLAGNIWEQLRDDLQNWLSSKELYESHGIPWKRGVILIGPPGNGKTHTIKALVNHFGLNTMYIRGFKSKYSSDEKNISEVFKRARSCAPVLMVLEDLDPTVDASNRTHFLNELDGFAMNSGIFIIASANDPAKLDPALVNRPSRFDRRYVFELPAAPERSKYLQFFTTKLDESLRLSAEEADALAAGTEGFSFAYLKELVLSGMMAWIAAGRTETFGEILAQTVETLRDQMNATFEPPEPPEIETDDSDDFPSESDSDDF